MKTDTWRKQQKFDSICLVSMANWTLKNLLGSRAITQAAKANGTLGISSQSA